MSPSPSIVIAGASGYIGKALVPKLREKFPTAKIVALSRSKQSSDDSLVEWKACDLFSVRSIEEALPKEVDLAFYLVHSMGPTAQLDQGSFADYDLILADNFSSAIREKKIKQLIYLGGLVPDSGELSLHLQSRLEVEEVFSEHQLPTTVFRAGLILGEAGSSFQILLKLVGRLPVMICPAWTQTLTTPVDLATVISALSSAALEQKHVGRVYDLAGCEPLTYLQMMQETARKMGLRRHFIAVPFFTPTLSRLWVTLITNTPKNLVYPLIESLEHVMVARKSHQFSADWSRRQYFELLEPSMMKPQAGRALFRFRVDRKTVRSVQRMPLPKGQDALNVRDEYFNWLKKLTAPLFQVQVLEKKVRITTVGGRLSLLELEFMPGISSQQRQVLNISRGLLVAPDNHGRLEFRIVLNRRFALAAIHDYKPSLPWFIYKATQALVHLLVMRAFAKHLQSKMSP